MNIRTLGQMKKQKGQSNPDKKTTSSYTGGQSSGMAVENPDVRDIMSQAQKNSKSPEQFAKQEKAKEGQVCKITLYSNGFIVQDGEFQDYNEPQNKEFMKELKQGYIPKALRKKYPKGGLSISLSDKTSQKYTPPPPPPYTAFSGSGTSLGGAVSQPSSKFTKKNKAQQNFILEPNKNKETTVMQVRLRDGQKITVEANLDTSLQDVFNHISTISGVAHFELVGGFPPRPLDLNSTVEKSDLMDSTLIQK